MATASAKTVTTPEVASPLARWNNADGSSHQEIGADGSYFIEGEKKGRWANETLTTSSGSVLAKLVGDTLELPKDSLDPGTTGARISVHLEGKSATVLAILPPKSRVQQRVLARFTITDGSALSFMKADHSEVTERKGSFSGDAGVRAGLTMAVLDHIENRRLTGMTQR